MANHSGLTGDNLHEPKPHAASHVGSSDAIQMASATQPGLMSAEQAAELAEGVTAAKVAAAIGAGSVKSAPVDADVIGYLDSEDDGALVTMTVGELKAALTSYFDTLYAPLV